MCKKSEIHHMPSPLFDYLLTCTSPPLVTHTRDRRGPSDGGHRLRVMLPSSSSSRTHQIALADRVEPFLTRASFPVNRPRCPGTPAHHPRLSAPPRPKSWTSSASSATGGEGCERPINFTSRPRRLARSPAHDRTPLDSQRGAAAEEHSFGKLSSRGSRWAMRQRPWRLAGCAREPN